MEGNPNYSKFLCDQKYLRFTNNFLLIQAAVFLDLKVQGKYAILLFQGLLDCRCLFQFSISLSNIFN